MNRRIRIAVREQIESILNWLQKRMNRPILIVALDIQELSIDILIIKLFIDHHLRKFTHFEFLIQRQAYAEHCHWVTPTIPKGRKLQSASCRRISYSPVSWVSRSGKSQTPGSSNGAGVPEVFPALRNIVPSRCQDVPRM